MAVGLGDVSLLQKKRVEWDWWDQAPMILWLLHLFLDPSVPYEIFDV